MWGPLDPTGCWGMVHSEASHTIASLVSCARLVHRVQQSRAELIS